MTGEALVERVRQEVRKGLQQGGGNIEQLVARKQALLNIREIVLDREQAAEEET